MHTLTGRYALHIFEKNVSPVINLGIKYHVKCKIQVTCADIVFEIVRCDQKRNKWAGSGNSEGSECGNGRDKWFEELIGIKKVFERYPIT